MFRKMMVPLDGSSFSETAIRAAEVLANRFGSGLVLAHVHVPFLPASYVEAMPATDPWEQTAREQETEYLKSVASKVESVDVGVEVRLLEGPIVKTLAGFIEDTAVDLVVMTTHGRGVVERAWLGSVADGLVRESAAPVLLLRPPAEEDDESATTSGRFRHVLIPLDDSPRSTDIIRYALAVGGSEDTRYTLLTAVPPPILIAMRYPAGTVPLGRAELEQRESSAVEFLRQVAQPLRESGVDVETVVISHTQPAAAILEHARDTDADLIALATHGRRPLARAFLGSVADKLVRGAAAPVLVYRPEA